MQSYHNLTEVVLASRMSFGNMKCFISLMFVALIMNLANQYAISISGNLFILLCDCDTCALDSSHTLLTT